MSVVGCVWVFFFLVCSYHSCTTFHQFCYAELVFTAISPNNVIWIKGSANANRRNSDTHPAHPLQWLIDTICNFFFQYLFRFNQSIKIDFETTRMHAKMVDCFGFVFHTHSWSTACMRGSSIFVCENSKWQHRTKRNRERGKRKKHTANLNEHMVITRAITSQAFSYKPYPPSLQLPKRNTNYTTLVGNQQTEKKIP